VTYGVKSALSFKATPNLKWSSVKLAIETTSLAKCPDTAPDPYTMDQLSSKTSNDVLEEDPKKLCFP